MHKHWWKPARVQGYLAAVLFSSLALFWVSCSKNNQMVTNPSTDLANFSLARLGGGGMASPDFSVLGSGSSFAVLGASTVTNTGASLLDGDAGVSPGTAMTGFLVAPGPVTFLSGGIHAGDAVAAQAHSDAVLAYAALKGLPCPPANNLTGKVLGTDPGAVTLAPGVYCFSSSAQLTGTLNLVGDGPWVFQITSTLTTASNSSVLVNGHSDCSGLNVFWQVGSSATLGTGTHFVGNILALTSITLTTGVNLSGSALALNGAVTMDTDTVSVCQGGARGKCRVKVTGGGSIRVAEGFASFGFEVQQKKDGRVKGQLEYVNHASGTKIKIREFTSLLIIGNTATFAGTGTINRLPGSFIVTVTDEGEPGRNDRFSISISGGPTEEGALRSGNIQIHEKKCGGGDDDDDDEDDDEDGHDGHHDGRDGHDDK